MITRGSAEQVVVKSARPSSDRTLVADCLNGDESAWTSILEKYKRLIFSIPLRYGLSQADASDVFQAVCLDLLNELPRLRNPDALPKWLIQTTARKCWRNRRQEARFSPQGGSAFNVLELEAPPEGGPEEILQQIELDQLLRSTVQSLPPRCRRMIEMLFYETPARPYCEVAAALGVATGSIGFLRLRCLRRLRQTLERSGFERGIGRSRRDAPQTRG